MIGNTFIIRILKIGLPLFVAFNAGCGPGKEIRDTIGEDLTKVKTQKGKCSIRREGIYSLEADSFRVDGSRKDSVLKLYSPLIFINDSNLHWSNGVGCYDNGLLKLERYRSLVVNFKHALGYYKQIGDTIRAKLPVRFVKAGKVGVVHIAYYQGVLVNQDTIVDWHMIEPYPTANRALNDNFIWYTTKKKLYFIESKELNQLDSLYRELGGDIETK